MIKLDRICVWLYIVNLVTMMMSSIYFSQLDELLCWSMGGLIFADCIVNHNWKRYGLLWVVLGVLGLYTIISLLFRDYNTPEWILLDTFMTVKPFWPLCAFIGMRITLTPRELKILEVLALYNIGLCLLVVILGVQLSQQYLLTHIYIQGQVCITSVLTYVFCRSLANNGVLSKRDLLIIVFSLVIGLYCQRSKYYGEFVLMLFMLFVYRPGFISNLSLRNLIVLCVCGLVILGLIWQKLAFYYLESEFSADTMSDNIARMALLYVMMQIWLTYPVFGSGLASFGSYPSAWHYSDLYYEYNLNLVWGLSPDYYDFVADSFTATVGGQFGILGLCLYGWFFIYLYRQFNFLIRMDYPRYRNMFIVGVMILLTLIIENSNGNMLFTPTSISVFCLLGLLISYAANLRQSSEKEGIDQPSSPIDVTAPSLQSIQSNNQPI